MAIIGRGGMYRHLDWEGALCDSIGNWYDPDGPHVNYIAIGDPVSRRKEAKRRPRKKWDKFVAPGVNLFIQRDDIGQGSMIMSGAVIHGQIGEHVVVGNNAVVSHDCVIGDFVTIGPGAVICGGARVLEGAFIGANATVTPGAVVPEGQLVKAGTVWTKS